ncbi:MAG: hypothetical protein U5K00_13525 [Melioribacteraceae bacterium]|nr:hypothetical protein [Melioribacteraceae bacterium]
MRTENFNEFSDYLSIIRYIRYGYKGDPFYARLGALDYATLGHGSIMYLYNNSLSYDTRKVGLAFDVDFTTFGVETVYSAFGEAGIVGLRGYARPLQFTDLRSVPVIGQLETGVSVVSDFHQKAGVVQGNYDPAENKFNATQDEGSITIVGFDIGLPIVNTSMLNLDLYFDYNKIINFGDGAATGFIFSLNGLGLVDIRTRLERRINGDEYIPSYFNSFYEIERFRLDKSSNTFMSKAQALKNAGPAGNGWYGELLITLLGTFDVLGSYQRLDKDPKSGILHIHTEIMPEGIPYVFRAGYDKVNIRNEKDLFKLDDRSYLFAELGYKPLPYLIVSLVYHWTFTPIRDADNNVLDYEPQKKIEPRISFVYPLNF